MTQAKFATCAEACAFVGIEEPRRIKIGGWVRSDALDCGKRGRLDGAVKFWPDEKGGIAVNNRKADSDLTKRALFIYGLSEATKLSRRELLEQKRRTAEARRRQAEAERREVRAGASIARQLEAAARSGVHPYLQAKRVASVLGAPRGVLSRADLLRIFSAAPAEAFADGERPSLPAGNEFLFVPLTGAEALAPMSAQLITDAQGGGNKRLLKGTHKFTMENGEALGLLWAPADLPFRSSDGFTLGLAEGVATALSVRRLFGFPCCAGIDCGNLAKAARTLRRRYPNAHIKIMADRDPHGAGWAGAREALAALSLWQITPNASAVLCPEANARELQAFRQITGRPDAQITDFNDYEIARTYANQ